MTLDELEKRVVRLESALSHTIKVQIELKERKRIYALIEQAANHTGNTVDSMKSMLKSAFAIAFQIEPFSLANCEQSVARAFGDYIVLWGMEEGIAFSLHQIHSYSHSDYFVNRCCSDSLCCVCGKEGQVGKVLGRQFALCAEHFNEIKKDQDGFVSKYHFKNYFGGNK